MGLKRDLLVTGAILTGVVALSVLSGNETGASRNHDEDDDDLIMNTWDDEDEEGNKWEEDSYNREHELPEGYVELYNGSIAKISDIEDIDDLADPSDYYS